MKCAHISKYENHSFYIQGFLGSMLKVCTLFDTACIGVYGYRTCIHRNLFFEIRHIVHFTPLYIISIFLCVFFRLGFRARAYFVAFFLFSRQFFIFISFLFPVILCNFCLYAGICKYCFLTCLACVMHVSYNK